MTRWSKNLIRILVLFKDLHITFEVRCSQKQIIVVHVVLTWCGVYIRQEIYRSLAKPGEKARCSGGPIDTFYTFSSWVTTAKAIPGFCSDLFRYFPSQSLGYIITTQHGACKKRSTPIVTPTKFNSLAPFALLLVQYEMLLRIWCTHMLMYLSYLYSII